jgi:hypothetical protein
MATKSLTYKDKITVSSLVSKATELKSECMALSSYRPELIEGLYEDVMKVESQWGEMIQDNYRNRNNNFHSTLTTCIMTGIIAIAIGAFITLWVAMGTTWRNAEKAAVKQLEKQYTTQTRDETKRLQTYLEKEQFQYLGYEKQVIFGKEVWVKK